MVKKFKMRNKKNILNKNLKNENYIKKPILIVKSSFLIEGFASWYLRLLLITLGGWRRVIGLYFPFAFSSYLILYFFFEAEGSFINFLMSSDISVHLYAFILYLLQLVLTLLPFYLDSESKLNLFFFKYARPELYTFFESVLPKLNQIKYKK